MDQWRLPQRQAAGSRGHSAGTAALSFRARGYTARVIVMACVAAITWGLYPATVYASDASARDKQTIVFVCLQGMDIGNSIPTRIRDGLSLDGLAPLNDVPKDLTAAESAGAAKIIAFDAVPEGKRGTAEVTYWPDVPQPLRDYAAARDAVVQQIDNLVPSLTQQSAKQILEGMITAVDERRGLITVQVESGVDSGFKVQDALIFNAVHPGDYVAITVENIAGIKTIVGLKKL